MTTMSFDPAAEVQAAIFGGPTVMLERSQAHCVTTAFRRLRATERRLSSINIAVALHAGQISSKEELLMAMYRKRAHALRNRLQILINGVAPHGEA